MSKESLFAIINNIKGTVWLVFLIGGIGGSFALSQYKISELQVKVSSLEANTRSLIVVQTQLVEMSKSIDDLKAQNKETYRLLLDISKR